MNIYREPRNLPEGYVSVGLIGVGLIVPMPKRLEKVYLVANPIKEVWPTGSMVAFPLSELAKENSVTNFMTHILGKHAVDSLATYDDINFLEIPDEKAEIWSQIGKTTNAHYDALGL